MLIFFIFFIIFQTVCSQSLSAINIVKPIDCNRTSQYYDITFLKCNNCPPNSKSDDCKNFFFIKLY